MAKTEEHKFYCLNCGKPGIPLRRKLSFQHGAMHRKKLYCPNCKTEVNHIEIKTLEQEEQFKEDFKNGVYKHEAEESLDFVRNSR
jgi:hypothetical protein